MKQKTYFLTVLTPLHVGAGQGLSHVDLPIVREVHTGFPFVPGSSVKGCVREYFLKKIWKKHFAETNVSLSDLDEEVSVGGKIGQQLSKEEEFKKDLEFLRKVFGTAGELKEGNAGKVIFTDARLLLFPVRSVSHIFLLATCPYALERYARDTGKNLKVEKVEDGQALCYSEKVKIQDKVMLEEFVFEAKPMSQELKTFIDTLKVNHKDRIVCVSDTVLAELVQNYTEVQTHVKIDPDKGTVKEGALWTSEYLPAESVLYVNLFMEENLEFSLPSELWLGGDMTTGKGLVKVEG